MLLLRPTPFLLLLLVTATVCIFSISGQDCRSYSRCGDCIRLNPNCAWCNDINTFRSYANSSTNTAPAPLCGTPEELENLNCPPINTVNPRSSSETQPVVDSPDRVSISSARVSLRPGEPATFDIGVSPAQSIPVDMYLLMDLSLTMQDDLNNLRAFAGDLVARMKNLSSDFRIGFGSFIDKTVAPFADDINTAFPCAADADLLRISTDDCEPIYAYRHRLSFTENTGGELEQQLADAALSASPDNPESLLDALLQVAVCEEEIGWRVKGDSRRIVVAITDGDYHYALDGKLGGILTRPDRQCLLDPNTNEFTSSHLQDYPSSAFISDVLNDNRITPIFAVPSQVREVYDGLVAAIRSATVETLSADSSDLISLIENQYRLLLSTVVPVLSRPSELPDDLLEINVLPVNDCSPGNLRANSTDVCENVNFPDNVTYRVEITARPEACQLLSNQSLSAQIQFIGFGSVGIEMSLECDCDCAEPVENSDECSGAGLLECSTCICNDEQTGGPQCDCPIGAGTVFGCIDPLDSELRVCNGQGRCGCGQCICDKISEGSELDFEGEYCQYNPQNCPLARDESGEFKPCAGHGTCINSRCECNDDFTGGACECTRDNSTCRRDDDSVGILCSGFGECTCGICLCSNYSQHFGQFCENCALCRTACSRVSPCVQCNVVDEECPEDSRCEERVHYVGNTTSIPDFEGLRVCSFRVGSCEVRYSISTDVEGDEDTIYVAMDSNQRAVKTLKGGSSDCDINTPIWPIFVGIILGIILIGVLALVLWRCCTYIGEYLEYQQWVKSVKEDSSKVTGDNPLFVDPNARYHNPRYSGAPSVPPPQPAAPEES